MLNLAVLIRSTHTTANSFSPLLKQDLSTTNERWAQYKSSLLLRFTAVYQSCLPIYRQIANTRIHRSDPSINHAFVLCLVLYLLPSENPLVRQTTHVYAEESFASDNHATCCFIPFHSEVVIDVIFSLSFCLLESTLRFTLGGGLKDVFGAVGDLRLHTADGTDEKAFVSVETLRGSD